MLVYKVDRLTRSTKNLIELVELFNANNCAFNSLVESIDAASATGRTFFKIAGIFAEFERENGEKIQTIHHEEAIIVRRIFNMYLHDNYSLNHIARVLNAEKVSTKRGSQWQTTNIKHILTNPTHIGRVPEGKRFGKITIDEILFNEF